MKTLITFALTLLATANIFGQKIESISHTYAEQGSYIYVEISGSNTHFGQATTTIWFQQGSHTIINEYVSVNSETSLTTGFYIPYTAPAGSYDFYSYNEIDGFLPYSNALYINGQGIAEPRVYAYTVNPVYKNETVDVWISGSNTHFMQATNTQVYFKQASGTILMPDFFEIEKDDYIQLQLTTTSQTPDGYYDLVVENSIDGQVIGSSQIYVTNELPQPSIQFAYPDYYAKDVEITVGITGRHTHFSQATNLLSFVQGSYEFEAYNIVAHSNNYLEATVFVKNSAPYGFYNIKLQNNIDGLIQSNEKIYVYELEPEINIQPVYVLAGNDIKVEISGVRTSFTQATNVTVGLLLNSGNTYLAANAFEIVNDNQISAYFNIDENLVESIGYVQVTCNNRYLFDYIEVVKSLDPVISFVSQSDFSPVEKLEVYISGKNTHFNQATNLVWISDGINEFVANSVYNYEMDNSLWASFYFDDKIAAGTYNLFVSNAIDGVLKKEGCITIETPVPQISYLDRWFLNNRDSLNVNIYGINTSFSSVTNVWFQQATSTILPVSFNAVSDTQISAVLDLNTSVPLGNYDLHIETLSASYLLNKALYVYSSSPSIYTNKIVAPINQNLEVQISGYTTHFMQASQTMNVWFQQASGTAVFKPEYINNYDDNKLSLSVFPTANVYEGYYHIMVQNSRDGLMSLPYSLLVTPASNNPSITTNQNEIILPGSNATIRVTGFGTHFENSGLAASNVWLVSPLGINVFANKLYINSNLEVIAEFVIPANIDLGSYTLKILSQTDGLLSDENAVVIDEIAIGIDGKAFICEGTSQNEYWIYHRKPNMIINAFVNGAALTSNSFVAEKQANLLVVEFPKSFEYANIHLSYWSHNKLVSLNYPVELIEKPEAIFHRLIPVCGSLKCFAPANIVVLDNQSKNAIEYNWDFGDGIKSTDEYPVHEYATAGTYTIYLTASNQGCSHTSFFKIDVESTISEVANTGISIYPNPASNFVTVQGAGLLINEIEIIDIAGKLVLRVNESIQPNPVINVSQLLQGMYNIRIKTNSGVFNQKFIKK